MSRALILITSAVARAKAMHLDSTVDLETTCYFFYDQDTKFEQKYTA